jgi:hypothetical protein
VDTGSREENASNKEIEIPFRFDRNGSKIALLWTLTDCRYIRLPLAQAVLFGNRGSIEQGGESL